MIRLKLLKGTCMTLAGKTLVCVSVCVSETVPLVERARLSAVHSVQCRQVATDKTTKFLYKTIKHLVLLYIICYNIFIDYKYESGNNCYIINTVVHVYFTDFDTCVCFFLISISCGSLCFVRKVPTSVAPLHVHFSQ